MTQHDDELLAGWLAHGPQHGPDVGLDLALSAARTTRQRPAWLVALAGGTIAERPTAGVLRYAVLATTVVALLGLLVGAMVIGGLLPRPGPGPSPALLPTEGSAEHLVAYSSSGRPRLWIAKADGSGAREMSPDGGPQSDGGGEEWQAPLGWTADGSRIVYHNGLRAVVIVNLDGTEARRWAAEVTCPDECSYTSDFALSPDGTRVAFMRFLGDLGNESVVAVLDLERGAVVQLDETRSLHTIFAELDWSPDGTRLVLASTTRSGNGGGLFVMNADGSDLRAVTPTGQRPRWSPDGSRIAFVGTVDLGEGIPPGGVGPAIYTVRPDGTDLQRLTDDGMSWVTDWTADGRIAFVRIVPAPGGGEETQVWVMDADGGSQQRLSQTLGDLSSAGCVICVYPTIMEAYWQRSP